MLIIKVYRHIDLNNDRFVQTGDETDVEDAVFSEMDIYRKIEGTKPAAPEDSAPGLRGDETDGVAAGSAEAMGSVFLISATASSGT